MHVVVSRISSSCFFSFPQDAATSLTAEMFATWPLTVINCSGARLKMDEILMMPSEVAVRPSMNSKLILSLSRAVILVNLLMKISFPLSGFVKFCIFTGLLVCATV